MNVTFNGYVAFTCNSCKTLSTIESGEMKFEQDESEEAQDDSYIRYLTKINMPCTVCAAALRMELDVWEHPEAVANYSYHSEQGVHGIQCEFNIEHYFDDEESYERVAPRSNSSDLSDRDTHNNNDEGGDEADESNPDAEYRFNESSDAEYDYQNGGQNEAPEGYIDHYDDD